MNIAVIISNLCAYLCNLMVAYALATITFDPSLFRALDVIKLLGLDWFFIQIHTTTCSWMVNHITSRRGWYKFTYPWSLVVVVIGVVANCVFAVVVWMCGWTASFQAFFCLGLCNIINPPPTWRIVILKLIDFIRNKDSFQWNFVILLNFSNIIVSKIPNFSHFTQIM